MSKNCKKPRTIPFAGGVLVTLLIAYMALVVLFVWLVTELGDTGGPTGLDRAVMYGVKEWHSPAATVFFRVITELGGPVTLAAITPVIAAVYWISRHKKAGLLVLSSVVGATVINLVLKGIFQRDRPDFWMHLVQETGYSFPSGHAMASSALAIALLFLLWKTSTRWYALVISISYILLVGLSRMYLGVHYPTDIVAGWCVSFLWVSIVALALYQYMVIKANH